MKPENRGNAYSSRSVRPEIRAAVFGVGRVGATIAAAWLRYGAHVTLVDVDQERIKCILSSKELFANEPGVDNAILDGVKRGKCTATSNTAQGASGCDCIFIAVPAGLKDGKVDLSAVKKAASDIGRSISKGAFVSLETSVPPGTTRNIVAREIEDVSGLKAGESFYVSYSPERISEGRALQDLEENYEKVVSGINETSLDIASQFYSKIAKKGVIRMSSLEAAEAEKLFEGIYRDVNIALANELASYCESFNLDFWEIRSAANSQPHCYLHKPGLGVGGACIPVYPWFVINQAEEIGNVLELVKTARRVNDQQPSKVLGAVVKAIRPGEKVAVLGLAFRGDVDDDRFSPSYTVINELEHRSAELWVHDDFVNESSNHNFKLTSDLEAAVRGAKLVIVATDHSEYKTLSFMDIARIAAPDAIIIDARGVLKRPDRLRRNWHVIGVGNRVVED
jgi:UDP-N-acetyl-D-glucosamine dehydrogenase